MHIPSRALILFAAALTSACGPALPQGGTTPGVDPAAIRTVTGETYGAALRTFFALDADEPAREVLRTKIVTYLGRRTEEVLDANDYDAAVDHFASMLDLYTSEDVANGTLPRELEPIARWVVEKGSPRGDEARVMSALLVLTKLHPDDASLERSYREIVDWGREARAHLPTPIERYETLIDVWEEHSRLTPAPEALASTARLYLDRRDALVRMLRPEGQTLPPLALMEQFQRIQQVVTTSPVDVAAVYLRQGDMASALSRVDAMGGAAPRFLQALREAAGSGQAASEAIVALAAFYQSEQMDRADVSRALCRYGLRHDREQAAFPLCLARIARDEDEHADATAWYAEAIRLAPDERDLYDEALQGLSTLIGDSAEANPAAVRAAATQAERILTQYREHFPGSMPTVREEQLELAIGRAELSSGNAGEARRRFEASIHARESPEALMELGSLALRTGDAGEAGRLFRRALDLSPQHDRSEGEPRATILGDLGDALRAGGDPTQAQRMYQQALELYDAMNDGLDGQPLAQLQAKRGFLLDRLGRHADAAVAFRAALSAAPSWRSGYVQILSHLVSAQPDAPLAHEVFRRAQRQLTLEPEWKVYLALWVQAVAGRAHTPVEGDVTELLSSMSSGSAWWGKLAKFGSGELAYAELYTAASGRGEQTEATFYEGTRLLAAGDGDGAQRMLRQVIDLRMVSFFEYQIAQSLLALPQLVTAAPAAAAAAVADGPVSNPPVRR